MEQNNVIIVAGGMGNRMGSEIPKQFIELCGRPILMHTIDVFYNLDKAINIIVVLPEHQHEFWRSLIKKHVFGIKHILAKGGEERFYSVKNGLSHIKNHGLVAIHDGVRPLVSHETIKACFKAANEKGTAIPVIAATESIRKLDHNKNVSVDRSKYYMVQTPQVFSAQIINHAYQQAFSPLFTDDASVVEKLNYEIQLVEGNVENIKITQPYDLIIAEALLQNMQ